MQDTISVLREAEILITPQRIAIAEFVLASADHPSADEVWERVKQSCPTVSRATVYNTLKLLVEKGLIKPQILREGVSVFDPNTEPHHHFIDEQTGKVYDLPWDSLTVSGRERLSGFEVRNYQVVLRGRKREA